jgi:hypothetical protein
MMRDYVISDHIHDGSHEHGGYIEHEREMENMMMDYVIHKNKNKFE